MIVFGTVVIVVMVHPQKGQSASDCQRLSEKVGALSYDAFGTACWNVYGKAVQLNPVEHDIHEGFDITNFNFNANGKIKPAEWPAEMPGPKVLGI